MLKKYQGNKNIAIFKSGKEVGDYLKMGYKIQTVQGFCEEYREKIDIVRFVLFDSKTYAVYARAVQDAGFKTKFA